MQVANRMVHNKKKKKNEKKLGRGWSSPKIENQGYIPVNLDKRVKSGRMSNNEFNIQVHLKNHVSRGVVNSKSNNVPNRFRFNLMEFSIFILIIK